MASRGRDTGSAQWLWLESGERSQVTTGNVHEPAPRG